MYKKSKILFVGAFKSESKDGSVGGQMFACNTLINSKLSEEYDWILIDSTADSNVIAPFSKRLTKAIKRIFLFVWYLTIKRVDKCLIFVGDGFSFLEKGFMTIIAKTFRKKVILCPRSGLAINDVKSNFYRRYYSFVLKYVDVLVCQGNSWKEFYMQYGKIEAYKIRVIHNWLETEKYISLEQQTHPDIVRIGFMSWVDKNKGIFELINAFSKLESQKVELHIAGDGMAMNEVIALCKDLYISEKVKFYSWVKGEDKLAFLSSIDIYILPSYFEGYPNSLMEAMASGLPCIAANVGSIPDLIQNNFNGIIIEPKNIDQIILALKVLIDDRSLRQYLGQNAKQFILENNTIEKALTQFQKILN